VIEKTVTLHAPPATLDATLLRPLHEARGLVLVAHGSGSNRHSPRNRFVAEALVAGGLVTLLVDLLTEPEARRDAGELSVEHLACRLEAAIAWAATDPHLAELPVGLYGASTGAAVALIAAARQPAVRAVVSRGGRIDLADPWLPGVRVPVLLLVGGEDLPVLTLTRQALGRFGGDARLEVIPGASHLFPEPGALERVALHARDWFLEHLNR